jgi:hypothetical protein
MSAPDRKKTRTVTEKRWAIYYPEWDRVSLPTISRKPRLTSEEREAGACVVRVTLTYTIPEAKR